MRYALLATLLLLTLPASAPAQPLLELLALIEQHNPELVQQRRVLAATAAAGSASAGDDASVLELLRQQEQGFWRHFRVVARTGARVSPGQDGSGIDTRAGLEFSLPLGDKSGELAIAKERQRQAKARHTQAKDEARQRLAYERQRAALRAQVLAALAELQAAEIELAAVQQTLARRRERRPLQQRRVAAGVEPRDTLWALDDEITGLEKQERLLVSQLEQQRLAVALLAGEAWERVLGLLRQPASSTSKGLRQQGTWHGYGGQRPPRASHGGCQQPRAA
jgi:outer membrane protein TolC